VTPERILVVDDDVDITRFIEMNLRFEGYEVVVIHDSQEALTQIQRRRPDLVLLDVMMPRLDGVELTRRLRADPATAALPIIMLTAKALTADTVIGLAAGADDYVIKPFDTLELVARIRSTLRRHRQVRELSPLTGLPGNTRILTEIADRVRGGAPFAVCYLDIDHFKSVNDAYGFARGDEFISLLARVAREATTSCTPPAFLGHIGGDDFIVVCTPEQVPQLTERVITAFETEARALYDPADLERGYVEATDRRGERQRVGVVTLSIGVAVSTSRRFDDARSVVTVATKMKQIAKSHPGSYVAVDRPEGE